ncbi:MAG: hypothetical protein SPF98_02045, partial [Campylobacter sp.]|nr:hypothetical protein [Campylobacter sp.]
SSCAYTKAARLAFLGVRGCLLRNSRIPSPRLAQLFCCVAAWLRFLDLKPCAAQPLCKNFCTLFLRLAP